MAKRWRNVLPLVGLAAAVIANAAWISFLAYQLFQLLL
jgi:hypothetical protein